MPTRPSRFSRPPRRAPSIPVLLLLVLGLVAAPVSARAAGEYTIVDLGTVPGTNSFSRDVNKFGQIVGYRVGTTPGTAGVTAFAISPEHGVWFKDDDGDGVNDLMISLSGVGSSRAFALNDLGEVVGEARVGPGNVPLRATIWQGGTQTEIAPLGADSQDGGAAFDINNRSVVVGTSSFIDRGLNQLPFVWDGATSELAVPPGVGGIAWGINDGGQIVGGTGAFGNKDALFWDQGSLVSLPGVPGHDISGARALNEMDQITGFNRIGSFINPVLWLQKPDFGLPAGVHDLLRIPPQPAMEGHDINERGQIVGDHGFNITFLWLPEPAYGLSAGHHDLETLIPTGLGWSRLFEAWAINDWGQIVGAGERGGIGGEIHAFLMTPVGVTLPPPPQGFQTASNFEYSGEVNDPINTFSGELLLREVVDLDLGGPMPLRFERSYASALARDGVTGRMGENWRHGFEWTLQVTGSQADVITDRGRRIQFQKNGAAWELLGAGDIPFQLVGSGPQFVFGDPRRKRLLTFDASGKLAEIADGKGNGHTLTYTAGDLTQVADGLGRTLQFTYEPGGHLATVSDGTRTVTYGYTGSLLTSVTDLRGNITTYAYDAAHTIAGLLTAQTRPRSNVPSTQTYDVEGRVATQTDALGNTTTLAYDPPETRITDPGLGVRTHVHDPAGVLLSATNADGEPIAMGADSSNRRSGVTDREGNTTEMAFDEASGRLAMVQLPDGTTTTFTHTARLVSGITFHDLTDVAHRDGTTESFGYDAAGNLALRTDRASQAWGYTYDGRGQLLTRTNPVGGTTTFTYDTDGTLASVEDPAANTTTFGYDGLRRRVLVTHPDATTRAFAYDAGDLILEITDENGGKTSFAYDENDNVVSSTDPLGQARVFTYDDLDRAVAVSDPGGRTWQVEYDALGRVAAVIDPLGNTTAYAYDAAGRLASVTDPAGNVWPRTRDGNGRLTAWTNPLGSTVQLLRDSLGRVTELVSPLGHASRFTYDGLGRIATAEDPLGQVTWFTYEPRGGLASTTLPDGISTSFGYDALGLVNRITDPGGHDWLYDRDAMGRVVAVQDPLGEATTFGYDARSRLAVATFPGGLGTVARSYDGVGSRTRELYSDGTDIVLTYDAANRLTSAPGIALAYDTDGEIVSSNGIAITRDAAGRVATLTFAPGKTVTYAYDPRGLAISVTDWIGGTTSFTYDAAGRLTSIARPNGISTTFTYDDENRITGIAEGVVANTVLTRGAAGRVISAARGVPLPPSSGITPFAASYDPASQVASFTYDPLGRVTQDAQRTYVWDLASRLRRYTETGRTVEFTYDALGRLLTRTEGATTRTFVWNDAFPERGVSIVREGGSDLRYYVHTSDGLLLYSVAAQGNARHFYHYDERGNTVFLTGDAGSVTDAYAYSPYGELTASTGSSDNPFSFAGRHGVIREAGTSLYWMGRRVYDSGPRRFLSREPVPQADPLTINPYQYAASDPLRFIDPTGTDPRQSRFEGGALNRTLETEGKAVRWVTYVTDKGAASLAKDADGIAERIAKFTLRGTQGVPRPDKLEEVARLRQLADDARGVGKVARTVGAAGSVVGNAVDAWKFKERVENLTAETLRTQDANLDSLSRQMDAVRELVEAKKISRREAEALIRKIQAGFDESQRGAEEANRFGIFAESAELLRNTLVSFLPAPAQEAEKVLEKGLGDVFVVDQAP